MASDGPCMAASGTDSDRYAIARRGAAVNASNASSYLPRASRDFAKGYSWKCRRWTSLHAPDDLLEERHGDLVPRLALGQLRLGYLDFAAEACGGRLGLEALERGARFGDTVVSFRAAAPGSAWPGGRRSYCRAACRTAGSAPVDVAPVSSSDGPPERLPPMRRRVATPHPSSASRASSVRNVS